MRYTESFIFTSKETGQSEARGQELILRAGLAQQLTAGHYHMLPLGQTLLRTLERIIGEELEAKGAQQISMPVVHPADIWQESGRWEVYGDEMYRFQNRSERSFCLGPTNEEAIVDLTRTRVSSYKQLPFILYQFGTKFRDELRPKGGLLRAKEFHMKDAYSFDADDESSRASYAKMREAYLNIFRRTGIEAVPIAADAGEIGGAFSEEFIAPSEAGEDRFVIGADGVATKAEDDTPSDQVRVGIEIAHIFQLGTRYSKPMKLLYNAKDGSQQPVVMGCYGIGLSRMITTIIEQNSDEAGIIWPKEVAPYDLTLIPTRYDNDEIREATDNLYTELRNAGLKVLLDDRSQSAGVKFKDSNLLGFPHRVIVGPKSLKEGKVEVESRLGHKEQVPVGEAVARVQRLRGDR